MKPFFSNVTENLDHCTFLYDLVVSYSTITITSYDCMPFFFQIDILDHFVAETSITIKTVKVCHSLYDTRVNDIVLGAIVKTLNSGFTYKPGLHKSAFTKTNHEH